MPFTSKPGGHTKVQVEPCADFCSAQSVGSYSPYDKSFGNGEHNISKKCRINKESKHIMVGRVEEKIVPGRNSSRVF